MRSGNWIRHTATGGSGNLTLSRDSTLPALSDVFGTSGTVVCRYEIDDGSDSALPANCEAGIGTVTLGTPGSTLSLARTTPIATWVSGTPAYKNTGVTALTFSGTVKVRVSPISADASPYNNWILCDVIGDAKPSAGDLSQGGYATAPYSLGTTGFVILQPFVWGGTRSVTKAGVYCTTLAASSKLEVAIYELTDHQTVTKLVDLCNSRANLFDGSTTGYKQNTSSGGAFSEFYLEPGVYIAGYLQTGGSAFWQAQNRLLQGVGILGTLSGVPIGQHASASGQTSLPASATLPFTSGTTLDVNGTSALFLHLGW